MAAPPEQGRANEALVGAAGRRGSACPQASVDAHRRRDQPAEALPDRRRRPRGFDERARAGARGRRPGRPGRGDGGRPSRLSCATLCGLPPARPPAGRGSSMATSHQEVAGQEGGTGQEGRRRRRRRHRQEGPGARRRRRSRRRRPAKKAAAPATAKKAAPAKKALPEGPVVLDKFLEAQKKIAPRGAGAPHCATPRRCGPRPTRWPPTASRRHPVRRRVRRGRHPGRRARARPRAVGPGPADRSTRSTTPWPSSTTAPTASARCPASRSRRSACGRSRGPVSASSTRPPASSAEAAPASPPARRLALAGRSSSSPSTSSPSSGRCRPSTTAADRPRVGRCGSS